MVLLFGTPKQQGRGLLITEQVLPQLPPEGQKTFAAVSQQLTRLTRCFRDVRATFQSNPANAYTMQVRLRCRDASFELKASAAEGFYTDLYYDFIEDTERVGRRMAQLRPPLFLIEVQEFNQVITFRPKESSQELIPVFPMTEIYASLYASAFARSYRRKSQALARLIQARASELSKAEVKLLEELAKSPPNHRAFVSRHATEITALGQKLDRAESWEAGYRRDAGAKARAPLEALRGQSPDREIAMQVMPLSKGDVAAITEFKDQLTATW